MVGFSCFFTRLLTLLLLLVVSCISHPQWGVHSATLLNPARGPIIGVFAHPIALHGEYIAASYVKWIESAGGRVVPIPYNAPTQYLDNLVPQLNGLLFPGGAASVNDQAAYLYQLALQLNDRGHHFPVWGTCLGFEWILQIVTKNNKALDQGLDSMNLSLALNFTNDAPKSRLFGEAPAQVVQSLANKPITMNNHEQGIRVNRFHDFEALEQEFVVLATNVDRQGVEFVSAYESKNYPVFAVQFHPEKNNFEYGTYPNGLPYEVIDHSFEGILASQYFANFFIQHARQNDLHFADPAVEKRALIYNYQTFMINWPSFVESYVFKHDAKQNFWDVALA